MPRITPEISQASGPRDILQIRSDREKEASTGREQGKYGAPCFLYVYCVFKTFFHIPWIFGLIHLLHLQNLLLNAIYL